MENAVTVESITSWLTEQVQAKNPIGPDVWLDASAKLNVLLQGEQEKQFLMEQEVAKIRNILIEGGKSVAQAKSLIEETPEYLNARKQKAKIEGALRLIAISKLQARMSSEIYKSNYDETPIQI